MSFSLVGPTSAELPENISGLLPRAGLPPSSLSLHVEKLGQPTILISHLADVPRNPTSVMKLLTTYTALELLGPAYRWHAQT